MKKNNADERGLLRSVRCGVFLLTFLCAAVSSFTSVWGMEDTEQGIASWRALVKAYLEFREHAYPIALPYAEWLDLEGREIVADSEYISEVDPGWFVNVDAGTRFVADQSRLSKEISQTTDVVLYEDFLKSELIVLIRDVRGTFTERIVFKAPLLSITGYELYDSAYVIAELSKRRIVWWLALSPFESVADLSKVSLTASSLDGGEIMMMRSGAANTNIIIQAVLRSTNTVTLDIAYPTNPLAAATNGLEIYTCTNLNAYWWQIVATNLSTLGTNMITWSDASNSNTPMVFYAVGNADADTDLDGICDARERLVMHTREDDSDTDNDGNDDYHDPQPLNDQISRVYLSISMPVDGSVMGGVQ
ncbi:MAG: hypothetical protein EOM20_00015 [Spartobacteria bacterium]|nr:hypothetical protein [Spartobacteria bacterium]